MNKEQSAITLGEVTRERLHAYYRGFVSDPDIFMDMSKFFIYHYDPARIDAYCASLRPREDRKDFLILRNTDPIGELSLKHIDYEKSQCELSIHLQNDSVKGKGYGSVAERLALEYAFQKLKLQTVLADSVQKNRRSQHVLEKVGFTLTHEDDMFKYYRCDRAAFFGTK